MRFMTDQAVAQIATLEDCDSDTRAQALADADAVYGFLRRSEGQRTGPVPEEALRTWGEPNNLDPDRLNRAIGVLKDTSRVVALDG